MNRALVLACGNSLRGDDGAAFRIVTQLRNSLRDPATEVYCQQQWTPELAEPISQSDIVVFVDVAVGETPGTITCQQLHPARSTSLDSTHHGSPEFLLLLAEALYGQRPARAYLVTVAGAAFGLEENLSDPVLRAIPAASERINALLLLENSSKCLP
ncbi:MAG: hydrogenase maturation protease [Candidatus Sulfotelmatobacter sp.]